MTELIRKILLINISFFAIFIFMTGCNKGNVDIVTQQNGNVAIVTQQSGIVSLSWTAPSTYSDNVTPVIVAGYKLYYGVAQRTYSTVLDLGKNTVAYQLTGFTSSETGQYYFAVTAYDSAGNESDYSNELYITL